MKLATILVVACSMLAFGCSKKSDSAAPARAAQGQQASDTQDLKASGEKSYDNKVTGADVSIVGEATADQAAIDKVIADSADLTRDIATVRSITHVVETQSNTIDLYAGDTVVAVLESKEDVWSVKQSANSFSPKMIKADKAGDPAALQSISFTFESCTMSEPAPEQGKGEKAGKGKGEVQQPVETCKQILAVVKLERLVEQQQQEEQQQQQGPDVTPVPEQGKGNAQPAPEQGKGDQAGQGQAGQPAPAPAPAPAPGAPQP
jgi:hypothetical protein